MGAGTASSSPAATGSASGQPEVVFFYPIQRLPGAHPASLRLGFVDGSGWYIQGSGQYLSCAHDQERCSGAVGGPDIGRDLVNIGRTLLRAWRMTLVDKGASVPVGKAL